MTPKWIRWAAKAAVVNVCVLPWCGCDPFDTQFEDIEAARRYEADEVSEPGGAVERLKVMTYNLKFGGARIRFFFECDGERVHMSEDEVLGNLEGVAEKIRQVDPDILLLQEVDVDSKRVAGIDQVQWLLDETDLNYGAYASQWRASWIPRHGIGRIDSGNAILSRWPFEEATRIALPLISEQSWLTQYFYLKRNLLKSRLKVPGFGGLFVLDTHLAAFSKDGTRRRQVEEVREELETLDSEGHRVLFGGDLNLIPPGSEKTREFADEACDDGSFEPTDYTDKLDVLQPFYDEFEAAIPLEEYRADNAPHFTYGGDEELGWTRKIDYLFTNGSFAPDSGLVHQGPEQGGMGTIGLSDHAPVTAVLEGGGS